VQSIAGFGAEQWGVLHLLVTDRADVITAEMIDARSAFSIVIGGAGITADALRKAQQEQVKGVIVGGIDAGELRDYWRTGFRGDWDAVLHSGVAPTGDDGPTLLITEGFGLHPMSQPIFDMLARYDRQEAHLDGALQLDPPERRPRLVIPLARLPGGTAPSPPTPELRPGAIVRLLDNAHLGRLGRVVSTNATGRLPAGVRTSVATVQIGENERIVLPELALEIMEQA
jgi:hypothetical protein